MQFLSRGRDHVLFLTRAGAVLATRIGHRGSRVSTRQGLPGESHASSIISVANLRLIGSNPTPHIFGANELPGKANYILGNDPGRWPKNLSRYARVHYADIYPGVDLVFYGNGGRLEYDFIVSPGGDPPAISFQFVSDAKTKNVHSDPSLRLEPKGDLALTTAAGNVLLRCPVIYQEQNDKRQTIPGGV